MLEGPKSRASLAQLLATGPCDAPNSKCTVLELRESSKNGKRRAMLTDRVNIIRHDVCAGLEDHVVVKSEQAFLLLIFDLHHKFRS